MFERYTHLEESELVAWVMQEPAGAEIATWDQRYQPDFLLKRPLSRSTHFVTMVSGLDHSVDFTLGASGFLVSREEKTAYARLEGLYPVKPFPFELVKGLSWRSAQCLRQEIRREIGALAWVRFQHDAERRDKLFELSSLASEVRMELTQNMLIRAQLDFEMEDDQLTVRAPWLYEHISFGYEDHHDDVPLELVINYLEDPRKAISDWEHKYFERSNFMALDLASDDKDPIAEYFLINFLGFLQALKLMQDAVSGTENVVTGYLMGLKALSTMRDSNYMTYLARRNGTRRVPFPWPTNDRLSESDLYEVVSACATKPLNQWPITSLSYRGKEYFSQFKHSGLLPTAVSVRRPHF